MTSDRLNQEAFDQLLEALNPDRSLAGLAYETLRVRLIRYFEWKANELPDTCADETLTRLALKLNSGLQIDEIRGYAYGIARLISREQKQMEVRRYGAIYQMAGLPASSNEEEEAAVLCLETCLKELPEKDRLFILRYYEGERSRRIESRKKMAAELGAPLNALRNRALRLREKLERCVSKRRRGESAGIPVTSSEMKR